MWNKKQKILIWMSGGVDSAVAAYLLKKQWYEVVAGFMKNYVDEENPNCSTYQDANEAIKVAEFLWLEIISFDLRKEYEDKIIKYIYAWYEKWITPNPDILCNSLIKFDVFLDKALELWFDGISMGHYARILPPVNNPDFLPPYPPSKGGNIINLNKDDIKKRRLMQNWKELPYAPWLKEKSRLLRKDATPSEEKIWSEYLSKNKFKFYRQRPIDHFIADFYCSKLNLIIEIDWWIHENQKEYDNMRTELLNLYWLNVIRFSNDDVLNNFEFVCNNIEKYIEKFFPSEGKLDGVNFKLLRWVDYNKDQSYFLSWLNQYQLSKSLFPIGWMTKPEIRELAKKIWLPNADRKDSQWLCFIGKVPMREFLKQRLPVKTGDIILVDGTKVWEHEWAYFFTIWQSRGLDINKKAYVVNIDTKKNLVIVSYNKQEPDLLKKEVTVANWHWIWKEYSLPLECYTKIRYRQEPNPATMTLEWWEIKFKYMEDQRGIAPGQSVVAYVWDECVWGGVIV